ncbi:MAG: hypothetical protein R3F17_03200 [Planctomycetota bacterium]
MSTPTRFVRTAAGLTALFAAPFALANDPGTGGTARCPFEPGATTAQEAPAMPQNQ